MLCSFSPGSHPACTGMTFDPDTSSLLLSCNIRIKYIYEVALEKHNLLMLLKCFTAD